MFWCGIGGPPSCGSGSPLARRGRECRTTCSGSSNRAAYPSELAHHGFHAVNNHVLGYTLQELDLTAGIDDFVDAIQEFLDTLDSEQFPHMAAHVQLHRDGETSTSFELVLDLILDGLVRLDGGV